ncbi:MAG: cysteine--tRNA ligase [Candidatus Nealsonbacteria bacterium]|nr:cysteine--tRNA ligase [Candidatus Nealsonbacteria bacterium]
MYAYIQWDILVRFLRYSGYKVNWVMNITDVGHLTSDEDAGEDKMEKGARREKLSVQEIAKKYIGQFLESMDLLNIQRPDTLCRATEHIKEQIDLIKKIEEKGFAYQTKTGLVFDTSKFPDYAKFSKLNLKKQYAGSRVEIDPEKKQPWDFLLWVTNQPKHIMQWDSPWGKGFPGWHIECTAMSTKYLGNRFDIHTGGKEHIPVHHTNEIAQAYGAFGKQTANFWLHNEWLKINKVKVSKSLGNIILAADFIQKGYNPLSFRYLVMTSHYRQGLNFSWESLEASQNALNNLIEKVKEFTPTRKGVWSPTRSAGKIKDYRKKFADSLDNDLNTPKALALAWSLIKDEKVADKEKYRLLLDFDEVLGLNLAKIKAEKIPAKLLHPVEQLLEQRQKYREQKKWQKADEIREEIKKLGWSVEDTDDGPKVKRLQ